MDNLPYLHTFKTKTGLLIFLKWTINAEAEWSYGNDIPKVAQRVQSCTCAYMKYQEYGGGGVCTLGNTSSSRPKKTNRRQI